MFFKLVPNEMAGLETDNRVSECDEKTVGELLLEPTQLYARPIAWPNTYFTDG